MVALLAAAVFGGGVFFAAPVESVARRSGAVELELGYDWTHALAGVTMLSTVGGNMNTSLIAARADFVWAPLFVGAGFGLFGQSLHCNGRPNCEDFFDSGAGTMLEAGLRFGHFVASVHAIGPVTRSQPAIFPLVPATPIPLLLFGLRILD